jgi:hypothetical protein
MFSAFERHGVTDADTQVLQWDECRASMACRSLV